MMFPRFPLGRLPAMAPAIACLAFWSVVGAGVAAVGAGVGAGVVVAGMGGRCRTMGSNVAPELASTPCAGAHIPFHSRALMGPTAR